MALRRPTPGKYVVIWRKIGNEWKAGAEIFDSDLPASARLGGPQAPHRARSISRQTWTPRAS